MSFWFRSPLIYRFLLPELLGCHVRISEKIFFLHVELRRRTIQKVHSPPKPQPHADHPTLYTSSYQTFPPHQLPSLRVRAMIFFRSGASLSECRVPCQLL